MLSDKQGFMRSHGFGYIKRNQIFANVEAQKVFSLEYVDDNDEGTITRCISEPNTGDWQFYSNKPMDEKTKQTIICDLGA